jgi:DNA-binding MarR family transcriptional regulator
VSRQIALLEQLGLISRVMNDDDARSRHLSLTPEGRERLARARDARREYVRGQLADWPPEDVAAFAGLLHRFNGAV